MYMIGKLTGILEDAAPGYALVGVGGVGYTVRVPLSLSLRAGDPVSLFIYTAVRDDAIDLYGFVSPSDIAFFKQLMSVSGVGPKTALGIMGVSDISTLKRHIGAGDPSALTKIFGIGKKSAERIVVELRDKLASEAGGAAVLGGADGEVIEALIALGYSAQESRRALQEAGKNAEGTQARLQAALKYLGGAKV